jgi:hypothetical protein
MAEERTYSAKQVATRVGTDAKQLRKFFRDPDSGYDAVGQGGRYDFPESDIPLIQKAFAAWSSGKTKRNRPTRAAATAAGAPTQAIRRGRVKVPEGMHGNALDEDDLSTRTTLGIAGRVEKHNLTMKGGRLVPRQHTATAVLDREEDTMNHNEEQPIIDHLERDRGGDDYDDQDYADGIDED